MLWSPVHDVAVGRVAPADPGFDLDALRPDAERLGITPDLVRVPLPPDEIPEDSTCLSFLKARAERRSAADAEASARRP